MRAPSPSSGLPFSVPALLSRIPQGQLSPAAAIAYPDLVSLFAGTVLNQTGQAIEVISITMGVYLFLSLSFLVIISRLKLYFLPFFELL